MGSSEENLTWSLTDSGVPAIFSTRTVKSDKSSLGERKSEIKKAILPDGVTATGDDAFKGSASVTSTALPEPDHTGGPGLTADPFRRIIGNGHRTE